jgi:putative ABC transport system substrate-binding protein
VIDRRAFIGTLAGGLLAAPLVSEAQQAGRVPLVGFLFQGEPSTPSALSLKDSFSQGLRAEGYVEGQNITIEDRYSDLDGLLDAVNDLVRLNVAVIMAAGTPAALAAKRVTKTIPIVAGNMADPLADGLVASLARPGGNITGNTFLAPELGPKRLQLLREVLPRVTRVAVLRHPDVYSERTMRDMLKEIEAEAKTGRLQLQVLNARGPDDFDKAFSAMVNARAGALLIFPSPMFYANYRRVVDLAARHRLPTMYVFREAVEAGGLMCYGANVPDLTRRAGKYVAKILKGAKPADLPIEQPTKFEFVINLKTAKALGLTIPPSLLQRADQVME